MLFIAVVALLVLLVLVAVAVVDQRHGGFKNKKREGHWGEGTAPLTPPRRWEDLDEALCLVLVPYLAFVVAAAVCLVFVVGFVAACVWRFFFLGFACYSICRMQARTSLYAPHAGFVVNDTV